jgi:hypothetical protein
LQEQQQSRRVISKKKLLKLIAAERKSDSVTILEDNPVLEAKVRPSFSNLLEGAGRPRRQFRRRKAFFQPTREGSIPGSPGTDFPVYNSIPVTSFNCLEHSKSAGFYADVEAQCQV